MRIKSGFILVVLFALIFCAGCAHGQKSYRDANGVLETQSRSGMGIKK